ncbi:hypothetical protein HS088_TW12G00398 [Tripterygium wilfordii]|uniref:Uncharacterized protein n=1 Tax=Tripterygium wilfordii TaxID=458696 RepID=A0A7J7CYL8_TRIWF|nr:hypothetical protein HS088_TW12G00398 [Tripterygium wilfordii]
MGVVEDIRNLGNIKDKVLEKLAAAAVPKDALENARNYLEMVARDVTVAGQGLTRMPYIASTFILLIFSLPSLPLPLER